jgi:hypothetical protein
MMFCPIVSIVQLAGLPVYVELLMYFKCIASGIHVHGFDLFGLYLYH